MANIRPSHTETPVSFPMDQQVESPQLESFCWKLLLLSAMAYFVWSEKISIDIGFFSIRKAELRDQFERQSADFFGLLGFDSRSETGVRLDEEVFQNTTFAIDPSYAHRKHIDEITVDQCREKCRLFVKRYSPVAIAEMRRYGVPASILLAQSLLASDAGCDEQVQSCNNFFLRTCDNSFCKRQHIALGDDALDVFPNLWGSFRAQSLFFKNAEVFAYLIERHNHDPHTWAKALDTTGYSTDPLYGAKLRALVKSMSLEVFDQH
jgi:hypothetical protein